MESDLDGDGIDLGTMRVVIAFAGVAGYTRLTEEARVLVAAHDGAGEVLVTRPVVERARGAVEFDRIAQVRLNRVDRAVHRA